MWETVKIWKRYTKSLCILHREFSLSAAHKAVRYQLWLFVSYVQPLWLYTGICRMYTRMNNPLNQFVTAREVDFPIITSLISFIYLSSSIKPRSHLRMKSCECALIANVNGCSSIRSVIRHSRMTENKS